MAIVPLKLLSIKWHLRLFSGDCFAEIERLLAFVLAPFSAQARHVVAGRRNKETLRDHALRDRCRYDYIDKRVR